MTKTKWAQHYELSEMQKVTGKSRSRHAGAHPGRPYGYESIQLSLLKTLSEGASAGPREGPFMSNSMIVDFE